MSSTAQGRKPPRLEEGVALFIVLPRARRKRESKVWRDGVGLDEADTAREVAGEWIGGGIFVARNMWYVWTEARMKRQERGMTGRPRRRVRF